MKLDGMQKALVNDMASLYAIMNTSINGVVPQFLPLILGIAIIFASQVQAGENELLPNPPRTNMLPLPPIRVSTNAPRVRTREEMIKDISQSIIQIESQLMDPKLRPKVRDTLQTVLAKQKYYLLQYQTNASFGVIHDTNSMILKHQMLPIPDRPLLLPPSGPLLPPRSIRPDEAPSDKSKVLP